MEHSCGVPRIAESPYAITVATLASQVGSVAQRLGREGRTCLMALVAGDEEEQRGNE